MKQITAFFYCLSLYNDKKELIYRHRIPKNLEEISRVISPKENDKLIFRPYEITKENIKSLKISNYVMNINRGNYKAYLSCMRYIVLYNIEVFDNDTDELIFAEKLNINLEIIKKVIKLDKDDENMCGDYVITKEQAIKLGAKKILDIKSDVTFTLSSHFTFEEIIPLNYEPEYIKERYKKIKNENRCYANIFSSKTQEDYKTLIKINKPFEDVAKIVKLEKEDPFMEYCYKLTNKQILQLDLSNDILKLNRNNIEVQVTSE